MATFWSKSWIKRTIKWALTALVLAFVARHVAGTWRDFQTKGQSLRVEWAWVGVAVGLYWLGLLMFGLYFWRILGASSTSAGVYPSVRAYFISHLGKYVPGKALVVVMRAGLVVPYGVRPATAAFATLYETLVMMAAGSLLAGVCFALGSSSSRPITLTLAAVGKINVPVTWIGFGLGGAFLIVVWPNVFPRLAGLVRVPMPNLGVDALPRFSFRLLAEGLAWSVVGWVMLGLSQVAVIRAILPGGLASSDWPLAVGSVAVATVAGFVVPISPGGLGVREWVLWTALGSTIDQDLAVVAALILRMAWLVGELVIAAILTAIRPALAGPSSP